MATEIHEFKVKYRAKEFLGTISTPYFASMTIPLIYVLVGAFRAGTSRAGDRLYVETYG